MYFLVDLENVHEAGMQGSGYLNQEDKLILFYSDSAPTLEIRYLEDIQESGCEFAICKLKKARKNALDFYIVTKLGEIFGSGYSGIVAIISQDDGFRSAKEYWAQCSQPARTVVLGESIERAIISANLRDQRTQMIHQRTKKQEISSFYAAYKENRRIREALEALFAGTEYQSRIGEIEALLNGGKGQSPKVIYLNALHRFGRRDGLAVYRQLKSGVSGL